MISDRDGPILCLAGFAALMLILVLTGEWIPQFFRSILYASCIMGIFSVFILRNILRDARVTLIHKLSVAGLAIFRSITAVLLPHWPPIKTA